MILHLVVVTLKKVELRNLLYNLIMALFPGPMMFGFYHSYWALEGGQVRGDGCI